LLTKLQTKSFAIQGHNALRSKVTIIQSPDSVESFQSSPITYYAALIIIYGIILLLNFFRPIYNFYIMYFEINWAEFQFLEIFDILNMLFGALVFLFGFCLIYYKSIKRFLLIFGGGLLLLYNLLNPSHFLIFSTLISVLVGTPPIWMQVIPENLLGIYLSAWTLLSISNIALQCFGIYIATRIILNANVRKSLIQFLFLYLWVLGISGIILLLQSFLIFSLSASWSSLAVMPYILRLVTWIGMIVCGIAGMLFIRFWQQEPIKSSYVKFGQIALLAYSIMYISISFSDFAMKETLSLVLNSLFAGILILFTLKIPAFLKGGKK